ncbi:MAG: hypothetical protein EXR69_07075 [Myxococcales bacterium]|nr:hypothetical protein [Myxococcales bacterium]
MRFFNMAGPLTLVGLLWTGAAQAEPRGIVVRVDLKAADATTGDVVVHLKASTATKDVKVFDDGASPDVTGADRVYSGTTWVEADSFDVSISIGSTKLTGGVVSWDGSDSARDLSISVAGKTLTAEAAVPTRPIPGSPAESGAMTAVGQGPPPLGVTAAASGAPSGVPGDGGPPPGPSGDPGGAPLADPGATEPGAAGAPQLSPPPSGATSPGGAPPGKLGPPKESPPASKGGTSPLLYIGFGVGVLLLTWLLASNLRARGSGTEIVPLAEPGLFGPTTPSLSGGAAVWEAGEAGEADANALADALIATLARHHRVVVATGSGYTPAAVFGGPVYRVEDLKPAAIAKFADAVEEDGGLPIVVLVRGPIDPAGVAALVKALPEGAGPIVVTDSAGDVKVPVVQCRRSSDGWVFVTPAGEVHTRAGADGLTALA